MWKKTSMLVFLVLAFNTVNGQSKWSLRANAGIASGVKIVDGYYFSFDMGIPLLKFLEIAPTFSSASMIPNTFFSGSWNSTSQLPSYAVPIGGPRQDQEYGDNLSSISLLLQFKPFELLKNEKLKKHEIIIGAGISYNSYTKVSIQYEINGNDYELTRFSVKSNRAFEPYYGKLSYNYLFKENLFGGFVASLNGFDGEAEFLAGLQFGIIFK